MSLGNLFLVFSLASTILWARSLAYSVVSSSFFSQCTVSLEQYNSICLTGQLEYQDVESRVLWLQVSGLLCLKLYATILTGSILFRELEKLSNSASSFGPHAPRHIGSTDQECPSIIFYSNQVDNTKIGIHKTYMNRLDKNALTLQQACSDMGQVTLLHQRRTLPFPPLIQST